MNDETGSLARHTPTRLRSETGASLPVFPIAIGIVLLLGVVAIVLSMGDGDSPADATEQAPVNVEGDALAPLPEGGEDPSVGGPAPTVSGVDWTDQPVRIDPGEDGPMGIVLLAHWCPHCQEEVTEMSEWLAEEGTPEGVTLRAVSTLTDQQRPNYPPSTWLEGEDWPIRTLMDDEDSTVAEAYGLTATPYWVFVDGEGDVVARAAGRIPVETLEGILRDLASGDLSAP